MRHFLFGLLLSVLGLLVFTPDANAARNLTITSDKSSLFGDEEMIVIASPSGFTDGEFIHIKGAFYQEGNTNYFGYTKSGDSWIKNSVTNTSQRQIKVGEWGGSLIVKSDFGDSGYKGEGDYKLKVGFYYGSFSSVNWSSNTLSINISEPEPTPTPSPTPSPTPTPTSTPAPTPKPTIKPTIKPTTTPTSSPIKISLKTLSPKASVAGEYDTPSFSEKEGVSPNPSPTVLQSKTEDSGLIFKIFLLAGGILLLASILFFLPQILERFFNKDKL